MATKNLSLEAWLHRLEQLHPTAIDLGLERISAVANCLDVGRFGCPVITVGGTNGKGSCVKFLESIYHTQGYRVGSYTSPHLLRFNERIRTANQDVSDELLLAAFEQIEVARENISLTFFEFTTLAALLLFKAAHLDVLILEVGLGGRLDAVNIVDADLAIITSLSFDHTDWLGDTLDAIGYEKAGIFRRNRAAIWGDPANPPITVSKLARELGTVLYLSGTAFCYTQHATHWTFESRNRCYEQLPIPSLPLQNAATALMAISLLQSSLPVTETAIREGLRTANLLGRFQTVANPVQCHLDVAHNPASAQLLAEKCRQFEGNLVAVCGMLSDKDILGTLGSLSSLVSRWYLGDLCHPRGAKATELEGALKKMDIRNCYTYECVIDAFNAATASIQKGESIIVFGSFYTVAEILHLLQNVPSATS